MRFARRARVDLGVGLGFGLVVAAAVVGAGGVAGCGDDGGAAIDAAGVDAAVDASGPTPLNGCTAAGASDRTAAGASRLIMFVGEDYVPHCMKIKVGQSVTWSGDFGFHPLRPGTLAAEQPGNPIPATSSGSSLTVMFPDAGDFGFYCNVHGPSGMVGAIFVVP
jgi:plastocyanin